MKKTLSLTIAVILVFSTMSLGFSESLMDTEDYKKLLELNDAEFSFIRDITNMEYSYRFLGGEKQGSYFDDRNDAIFAVFKAMVDLAGTNRSLAKDVDVDSDNIIPPSTSTNKNPSTSSNANYSAWYNYGCGRFLPNPAEVFGHEIVTDTTLRYNSDSGFMETILNTTEEEANKYFIACREYGYDNDVETFLGNMFEAKSNDGKSLLVYYLGGRLSVTLDEADQ